MLQKYSSSSAHYRYQGKPFVSTFEGPGNTKDWIAIKAATGCFFIPDWSSLGAKPALQLAGGVADGLFSWAAWPTTSSHVHTGCRATASATTTGVSDTCLLNPRDEDQGSDGGAGSGLITTSDDRKSTATTASKTTATPKSIPTRSVQQGVLTCKSDIDNYSQGDSRYYATLTDISTAAQQMCEGLYTDFNDGGPVYFGAGHWRAQYLVTCDAVHEGRRLSCGPQL